MPGKVGTAFPSGIAAVRKGRTADGNHERRPPLGGFVLSGGTAFVVDAGITLLLAHLGLNRFAARILGIAVAMVVAWLMHRRVTFAMDGGARGLSSCVSPRWRSAPTP